MSENKPRRAESHSVRPSEAVPIQQTPVVSTKNIIRSFGDALDPSDESESAHVSAIVWPIGLPSPWF